MFVEITDVAGQDYVINTAFIIHVTPVSGSDDWSMGAEVVVSWTGQATKVIALGQAESKYLVEALLGS